MSPPTDAAATGGPPLAVSVTVEPSVQAGGVVLATVRTDTDRDVVLQGGEVTLGYELAYRYTEGNYFGATYSSTARRSAVVAAGALPGPTLLRADEHVEQQILVPVPAATLPTLACTLVSLRWLVRASVRYDGTHHAHAPPVEVAVLARGRGAAADGPPAVSGGRHPDEVRFEGVRTRELFPGDRVDGELVVVPARAGRLRLVRVELVLHQVVPHGPWVVDDPARNPESVPKEAGDVVARQALSGEIPVAAGGAGLRWPFALDAPERLPGPTLVAPEFSLRWYVRAVVDRRRARRTTVDLELDGSTTRREAP